MSLLFKILLLGALIGAPAAAQADLPTAYRYALIIGNNAAGPGQQALRFAERDADAFAAVLRDLGGHGARQIQVLHSPDRDEVSAALVGVADALSAHAARGEQAIFTFYYSGHARAEGLDFGRERMDLGALRAQLDALPTAVTLVVLDACRSGAFSQAKGAAPADDFSINAVHTLDARGMAVLTSSSANELSQESPSIGGSYFTHHLLVGLRGAAERNDDGRVSLKEAYDYAYNQTLLSTARTALGKQHVRFETRLVGHGDLPLTTPGQGRAHLEFEPDLVGDVVVSTAAQRPSVIAELHKVAGHRARIALPPGEYRALVRKTDRLGECALTVAPGAVTRFDGSDCTYGPLVAQTEAKGGGSTLGWRDGWTLELGVGGQQTLKSDYRDRLGGFGYEEQDPIIDPEATLRVGKRITPNLAVLVGWRSLDARSWSLDERDLNQEHRYSGQGLEAMLRASAVGVEDLLGIYGQLGLGTAWVNDTLSGAPDERHWGALFSVGAGLQVSPRTLFGGFVDASYTIAPALTNRLDDTHDLGGFGLLVGLRVTP